MRPTSYSESLVAAGGIIHEPWKPKNEESLFVARQADLRGELAVLETRRAQFDQQVEGLSKLIEAQRQVLQSLLKKSTTSDAVGCRLRR